MNQFEKDLRESLRRRQPPDGFAERTLTCIPKGGMSSKPPLSAWLRAVLSSPGWRWAAVGAGVLILSVGLFSYKERARRIEGERAKAEVLFALRLTGSKLREIQEHVTKVQRRSIEISIDSPSDRAPKFE